MSVSNGKITIKDVYELVDRKIDALEKKILHRIEIVEKNVNSNESKIDNLVGKLAVVAASVSLVVTFIGTYLIEHFAK